VLDRAIREFLPISRKVLSAVVEAQLDNDRGVDAANPELLKVSSLELRSAVRTGL
jgi:hypothetical protein